MPNRSYSASSNYRYGFDGKENDNEVKGTGNQYDYGFRIYDPRLGRFLSVDPLTKKFAWLSPYQYAENSPISNVDLDGLERSYAADGRVVLGPFTSDPLTNGRLYKTPPVGTLPYIFDQSKTAPPAPSAQPQLSKQDNLSLPVNLQYARVHETPTTKTKIFTPAEIRKENPYASYSDFERGMITSPTTQMSAMMVCPGCAVGIGGLQTYSGLKTGDYVEAGTGILTMAGGGLGIYAKYAPGSAGAQLAEIESSTGSHFLSRHGAQTSLSSQYTRAISGLTPDGEVGSAVDASRFFSNDLQLEALKLVNARHAITSESSITIDLGKNVGEGFLKGGGPGSYRTTTQVQAFFKDGVLKTLYPLLKK